MAARKGKWEMIKKNYHQMTWFDQKLTTALFLLAVIQFLVLCYINLTQMKYHMGYDASSYYLKAFEMWKQKSLMCENWVEQTTLYWDSAVPLAALLMNIFRDIFTAYGVANLIVDVCIIALMIGIMRSLELSVPSQLFALNLVICPYVGRGFSNSNDIFYFSSILTSGSWYGVKLALTLLFVYVWLLIYRNGIQKKHIPVYLVTIVLFLVSGISSGYYLGVTILIPAMLCGVIYMFVKNDWKEMISGSMLFTYLNLFCIILGKIIAKDVLNFTSKDSNECWVSLENFWENITSIFLGYAGMLQALPTETDVPIMSRDGIRFVFGWGIAMITLIGFFAFLSMLVKKFSLHKKETMLASVVCFNFIMFTFIYTTYGSTFFEERYLIIPFFFIVMALGVWIDSLNQELIFKKMGCMALVVLTVLQVCVSDIKYIKTKTDTESMDELADAVSDMDSPVVFFYGNNYSVVARNMRVYDTDKIYKFLLTDDNGSSWFAYWGDYTYYHYADEWDGPIVLCTDDANFQNLPEKIKEGFHLQDTVTQGNLYVSEKNILGMQR